VAYHHETEGKIRLETVLLLSLPLVLLLQCKVEVYGNEYNIETDLCNPIVPMKMLERLTQCSSNQINPEIKLLI
jgi:hypothetical protein